MARAPAKRRTQQQRTDASYANLLRAAIELVAERGYRAASLAAIGERAGYSRGLVTERFGSKEGLLKELIARVMTDWRNLVVRDVVGDLSGAPALSAVVHAHRRAFAEGPEIMRALYVLMFESIMETEALSSTRDAFRAMDDRIREIAEMYLERGKREGTLRDDVDVPAQVTLAIAVVRGITMQWLMNPDAIDLDRVYGELSRWIDRGLSAEPAKAKKPAARKVSRTR